MHKSTARVQPVEGIENKLRVYVGILDKIDDSQQKYLWLMELGKKTATLDKEYKRKEFEVPGCQSQTWVVPSFENNIVFFYADSAALISKGMVNLLADIFSGQTRKEIAAFDVDKLKDLKLDNLLTPGRRNGVFSMLKVIQGYGDK
jgi:cysteine desulfuration protein SufE